jgi:hypothetical protein
VAFAPAAAISAIVAATCGSSSGDVTTTSIEKRSVGGGATSIGSSKRALAARIRIAVAARAPTARPSSGPTRAKPATIGTAIAPTISGNIHGFSLTGSSLLTFSSLTRRCEGKRR